MTAGLCAADASTKRRFATGLLNLTLAGPSVNRYQKVDNDAAEWLPPQNRWYAARIIAVRQQYGLTVDRREADALDRVLSGCTSTEMIVFARVQCQRLQLPQPPLWRPSRSGTTTASRSLRS